MVDKSISKDIVEVLLLGDKRNGNVHRFTQDGGVVVDVWARFAENLHEPVRVLLSPAEGASATDMAYELHRCLKAYRAAPQPFRNGFQGLVKRKPTGVAVLSEFVAATFYVDELLRVVMPLTKWWSEKRLGRMRYKTEEGDPDVFQLRDEILRRMQPRGSESSIQPSAAPAGLEVDRRAKRNFRVIEAAPIAALLGVIRMTFEKDQDFKSGDWIAENASRIADNAVKEFSQQLIPQLTEVQLTADPALANSIDKKDRNAPALIQRVFLDRKGTLAQNDALAAVKADAATRLFDISCRKVTWAIIDSGIAAHHPAFFDWHEIEAAERAGRNLQPYQQDLRSVPNRIRAIYDFTLIDQIRNFDLVDRDDRDAAISRVIDLLARLPGRNQNAAWRRLARANLRAIAKELEDRKLPSWRLIEPLIRLDPDDGEGLPSDHGTHVAGTLGADWRPREGQVLLEGICPDINIYDLRVIPTASLAQLSGSHPLQATEFAVVAATEFVQHLNREAGANGPIIHGVNISLSIPHDVRNYGCGATPVCVACDALVSSGVTVVAAAGNRGWNEQELGFGNFAFCSITDPGNAYDVITVGSTHRSRPHTYGVSYFSSRGPTGDGRIKPDIVAPGEKIRGPVRGNATSDFDGTSMAAPFVSGAAAMLMARNRELIRNPKRIKAILCQSATDLGRERYFQGHGLLDALRALQRE
ncbi:MAG: S8 family peptidase [Novosphingobium sp.]